MENIGDTFKGANSFTCFATWGIHSLQLKTRPNDKKYYAH